MSFFVPMAALGNRPTIKVKKKNEYFHIVVFLAFDNVLVGDETVDHLNQNILDNRLSNLRAATKTMQNKNRTLPSRPHTSSCVEICYRPVDLSVGWKVFKGAGALARHLSAMTGETYFAPRVSQVSLHLNARGTRVNRYKDFLFSRDVKDAESEDEQ